MAKFQRETATDVGELPHRFEPTGAPVTTSICDVCESAAYDPRHKAWEQQQLADRERAAMGDVQREMGS